MGVASVSWVVGWALVPCTCPPPVLDPGLERGEGGGVGGV